jgi:hypothetical protein
MEVRSAVVAVTLKSLIDQSWRAWLASVMKAFGTALGAPIRLA